MTGDRVPTREDWGDLSDLDVNDGFRRLGGKTIEDVVPEFERLPIELASELRFAPAAVFNYYVFGFVEAALAATAKGQSDLASCFLQLVRDRATRDAAGLAPVWPRLRKGVGKAAGRQTFYRASPEIYGSFAAIRKKIEAAMRQHNAPGRPRLHSR